MRQDSAGCDDWKTLFLDDGEDPSDFFIFYLWRQQRLELLSQRGGEAFFFRQAVSNGGSVEDNILQGLILV